MNSPKGLTTLPLRAMGTFDRQKPNPQREEAFQR
jgi:hypothetical protein